uniref:Uncharacterized protein n=2 Tax=Calcidiscus leptoporus TaxID=127549 RepID=A0A7S0IQK6_9EUKA|mmetsp:Transcript_17012/g.38931  ORF Transcript_17012/g.38931 Transcript_17012/m.38931 type:complete len:128 (+) Transcript_17012:372-755(+)
MMQPKPASHLEFVSRRPLYYMGVDEVCTSWIDFLTRIEEQVRTTDDIEFALDMASNVVHGFGHECISGKWTHDGRWLGRETYNGNDKAINVKHRADTMVYSSYVRVSLSKVSPRKRMEALGCSHTVS